MGELPGQHDLGGQWLGLTFRSLNPVRSFLCLPTPTSFLCPPLPSQVPSLAKGQWVFPNWPLCVWWSAVVGDRDMLAAP